MEDPSAFTLFPGLAAQFASPVITMTDGMAENILGDDLLRLKRYASSETDT
jgi:hypothetical protein